MFPHYQSSSLNFLISIYNLQIVMAIYKYASLVLMEKNKYCRCWLHQQKDLKKFRKRPRSNIKVILSKWQSIRLLVVARYCDQNLFMILKLVSGKRKEEEEGLFLLYNEEGCAVCPKYQTGFMWIWMWCAKFGTQL